jgi:arsenate reductase (thioredoxin)
MKKVLFISRGNACRSRMAEAFARNYGWDRIAAFSAGSIPSRTVHPRTVAMMNEIGCDLNRQISKSLADLPADFYDYVIMMGCEDVCQLIPAGQREEWAIPDPVPMDDEAFRRVRCLIETRVLALIARCT